MYQMVEVVRFGGFAMMNILCEEYSVLLIIIRVYIIEKVCISEIIKILVFNNNEIISINLVVFNVVIKGVN